MTTRCKVAVAIIIAAMVLLFWLAAAPAKAGAEKRLCAATGLIMDLLRQVGQTCGEPREFDGQMILYCKNDVTGTWSIVVASERGSCIVAIGRDRRGEYILDNGRRRIIMAGRKIDLIVIHCTAAPEGVARATVSKQRLAAKGKPK